MQQEIEDGNGLHCFVGLGLWASHGKEEEDEETLCVCVCVCVCD